MILISQGGERSTTDFWLELDDIDLNKEGNHHNLHSNVYVCIDHVYAQWLYYWRLW